MALSLLSSHSSYTDIQSFLDPSRLDFSLSSDQMEYNNAAVLENNSSNYRNFIDGSQQSHNAINRTNNFHGYEEPLNFVDSPPNSKDSWSDEQQQRVQQGPTILNVQTIYSTNANRKRRMDWEHLDISQSANNSATPTSSKVPNLNGTEHKERDKKKLQGRGTWTDDIDFDLNGEFTSNTYLNNKILPFHSESFLPFSPALAVLKQELPSPQADAPIKETKSPQRIPVKIVSENHESSERQQNGTSGTNNVSVGSPQQITQSQGGSRSGFDGSGGGGSGSGNNGNKPTNGFHQVQLEKNSDSSCSSRNSPHQSADSSKLENFSDDYKFQYILAAATSIATKNNEETLTYLNQGQSYEIKLKKTGDLSFYRDKILRSTIKICFHERRLQYMEREQMQQWQASRPGERIVEVDVPLSYGLCHVSQPLNPNFLNTVDVLWDPMKEVGVYIKVNCISTEFTPKKHGGEKGVPFRIQIETYIETANNNNTSNGGGTAGGAGGDSSGAAPTAPASANNANQANNSGTKPIHAAACQIKVFKLKGADRKHKQDREKIQRRPPSEQEKYQPSYECTILNDIPLESITASAGCYSPEYMKLWPNSPVHMPKYDSTMPFGTSTASSNSSPIAINSVTSTNNTTLKLMDANIVSPQQQVTDCDEYSTSIYKDSTPANVSSWLSYHRLNSYLTTFAHFSGSDILRMSKEDLIQICGLADGIRMFNILHAKSIAPRLTMYISLDGSNYHAVYLTTNSVKELSQKIVKLPGFYDLCANISNMNGGVDGNVYSGWSMHSKYSGSGSNICNDASKLTIFTTGPSGVHVMVTDEVLNNEVKDDSLYALEVQNGKVLMKSVNKNENQ